MFARKEEYCSSIPEYLALIKNSKYILTNSFHGLVLSIIFKKEFITVVNLDPSRQQSLLTALGIPLERLVMSLNDINVNILEKKLDYEAIYLRLEELRRDSMRFLIKSLEKYYFFKETIPVKKDFQLKFAEKIFMMTLIYEKNKKIYHLPEFDTVYTVSLSTDECIINKTQNTRKIQCKYM